MNRQRGMSSLALVLLMLMLGSLLLNGLNQQLKTHIRRVSTESQSLRLYAGVQSAMSWAGTLVWHTEPAMQCQQHTSQPWRACLRVLDDQTVLLTAGSGEYRLWRRGRVSENNIEFSPHGWSDFCPNKDVQLCLLP